MWRPLYFEGTGSSPTLNFAESFAYPPVYSDGDTTITIRLKPERWSDGLPVTTGDVRFFFELYDPNKADIATHLPGEFPDNVRSVDYVSSTTFVMHLTQSFSQDWYTDNQLVDIVPLPAQSWDKTSSSAHDGNDAATTAGARRVFAFLTAQSETVSTYATDPLWQVVDGPWRIESYDPTTFRTVLAANHSHTGVDKPRLSSVVLETFSSATAEVDALRSGSLTFGYLPFSDLGLKSYFESRGFTVAAWEPDNVQWAELGYTSPVYGPLVRQLYLRQALQHLIDEPLYLKATLHGYGQLTYGPVPNIPGSPYVSAEERTDPDPYSVAAARRLLEAHGWRPDRSGVMVCERPGARPSGTCGAGIAKGRTLTLRFLYESGYQDLAGEVEAFDTAASAAGVNIVLDPQSESTMFSIGGECPPGPCNWGIQLYSLYLWDCGDIAILPTNGETFGPGNYWGGGYHSSEADRLIDLEHIETGLKEIFATENYLSRQIAGLWFPTGDNKIVVVSDHLHGWQPLNAFMNPRASDWYLTSG
jgi:peptide/nickel transport system substrate-binding protein